MIKLPVHLTMHVHSPSATWSGNRIANVSEAPLIPSPCSRYINRSTRAICSTDDDFLVPPNISETVTHSGLPLSSKSKASLLQGPSPLAD